MLSTHTEMLHPAGGFLHVNLGSPCGSPSSSLLQTWLLIKAPTGSVNSAGRRMSAFPTFTPQSTREMGDLALALSTATAWRTTGGVSSSAACTPHLTNEQVFCLAPNAATFSEPPHMWVLLVSLSVFSCSSVTVGFSGSEVAASLCGVALPHGDPSGQLCSHECLQELSCPLHGGLKRPSPCGCGEHSTPSRA